MVMNGRLLGLKNIFSLYRLRLNLMFRNAVLVIPIVATFVFLEAMYSVIPIQVSGSFLISGIFLFVVCIYISQSIQQRENDIQEEVMLLHSKSPECFYISRELVSLSIVAAFTILLIFWPVIKYVLNDSTFSRPLKMSDVIYGGIIIVVNGLCGVAVGDFFHQRFIYKRRSRLIAVVFVSIISICKHSLIQKFVFLKFLNFLLPPIMDGADMVGNSDIFDGKGTMIILMHSIIYVVVLTIIKIQILNYRKFSD